MGKIQINSFVNKTTADNSKEVKFIILYKKLIWPKFRIDQELAVPLRRETIQYRKDQKAQKMEEDSRKYTT